MKMNFANIKKQNKTVYCAVVCAYTKLYANILGRNGLNFTCCVYIYIHTNGGRNLKHTKISNLSI